MNKPDNSPRYLEERVAALEGFIAHFFPLLIEQAPHRTQLEQALLDWSESPTPPLDQNPAASLLADSVYDGLLPP